MDEIDKILKSLDGSKKVVEDGLKKVEAMMKNVPDLTVKQRKETEYGYVSITESNKIILEFKDSKKAQDFYNQQK